MKRHCLVKSVLTLWLILFMVSAPVSFTGCSGGGGGGDSDSPGQSQPASQPSPQPLAQDDPGVYRTVSGDVFSGTSVEGAEITLYDADGKVVNHDASQERGALTDSGVVTDSDGTFSITFKEDLYTPPYLVRARKKGGLCYFSLIGEEESHINVCTFTTAVIMELVGGTEKLKELMAPDNPSKDTFKELKGKLSGESFIKSAGKLAKRDENFSDDDVDTLVHGSRKDMKDFNGDVSRLLQTVETYMDVDLVTGTVSGTVKAQSSGLPLSGVTVSSPDVYLSAVSDSEGVFVLEHVPTEKRIAVNFKSRGYTSNQEIVRVDSAGDEDRRRVTLETVLKPVSTVKTLTLSDLIQDRGPLGTGGVKGRTALTLSSADGAIKVNFPFVDPGRFAVRSSLADEDAPITFEMTSIDPTSERTVFPGDFSAEDSTRGVLDDEEEEITLESVVLADMSLYDVNGEQLQPDSLGIESLPVQMRIPDNLQETYRQAYEMGTRTIPWWSFDENKGTWIREGDATLVMIDGVVYGTGSATHFSWWNIDWPISTHAVICGYVYNNEGAAVSGAQVTARGVDYQGNSYATTDGEGFYQLKVKKDSQVTLCASFGDISADYVDSSDPPGKEIDTSWEKSRYCGDDEDRDVCCAKLDEDEKQNPWRRDITLSIVNVSGRVETPDGDSIRGALVKTDSGAVSYTDEGGNYSLKTKPNTAVNITASYIRHGIKSSARKDGVTVLTEDLPDIDFTLSIEPVAISGRVVYEDMDGGESPMKGVLVTGDNGQMVETDEHGAYTLYAQQESLEITIGYKAFMPSGIYAEQSKTISINGNRAIELSDIVFVEAEAWLTGTVHDHNDKPFSGIQVVSSFGKAGVTGFDGTFKIRVPVDSESYVTASYSNAQLDMAVSEKSETFLIPAAGGTFSVGTIKLDNGPAWITGKVSSTLDEEEGLRNVKVFSQYGATGVTGADGMYRIDVPAEREDVVVTFSYESLDANGKRKRWAKLEKGTVTTGKAGSTKELNMVLTITSNPPVITSAHADPSSSASGETVTLHAEVTDPDGDEVSCQWYKGDVEITTIETETEKDPHTFEASHTFEKDAKTVVHEFRVVCSDGTNSVSRTVQVPVHKNTAPVVYETSISPKLAGAGSVVTAGVKAYDLEGDELTYAWSWKADSLAGVDVSADTSEIEFEIPGGAAPGNYTLVATVSDGKEHKVHVELDFEVLENRPPVIDIVSASPSIVKPGGQVTLTVLASDPDGDKIVRSWSADYVDKELSQENSFSWTVPTYILDDISGDRDVKFTATVSAGDHSVSRDVYVRVEPFVSNRQPVIAAVTVGSSSVRPGETVALGVSASDPDGDVIRYRWLDQNGRELSQLASFDWTAPSDIAVETAFEMTVSVSDDEYTVTDETTVRVVPGTDPLQAEGVVSGHVRDESGDGIEGVAVRIYSAEDNGEQLSLYGVTDGDGLYRFENITAGSYYIVIARDGYVPESKLFTVD